MAENQTSLADACRRFLPELVRLSLPAGLNCKDFIELVKEAYVAVGTDDFGRGDRCASISKVSRVTGLTRVDIRRIKTQMSDTNPTLESDQHRQQLTSLLRDWHHDTLLVDANGRPLPLPMSGAGASFESLARRYFESEDTEPLVHELELVGAIRIDADDRVVALRDYYLPSRRSVEYAQRIGGLFCDFARTVAYNLHRSDKALSRIEMRTTEEAVPVRLIPEFRSRLETEATGMYQRLDTWLGEATDDREANDEATTRLGFGIYQIVGE